MPRILRVTVRRRLVIALALRLLGCKHAETDATATATAPPPATVTPASASTPVVLVEVFSSEGCSSCPAAEELARTLDDEALAGRSRVAVLEEHVDYWDRLGWVDPFASPAWTTRQRAYAQVLGGGSYTPEAVVDGRVHEVGSREAALREAIRSAAFTEHVPLTAERRGDALVVHAGAVNARDGEPVRLLLALAERGLESHVTKGENAGRTLRHGPVLRELRELGVATTTPVEVKTRAPSNRAVVVFLQGERTRAIYAATAL